MTIDAALLRRMWPRAPEPLLAAVVAQFSRVATKYQLNTPLRLAHFLAQVSHESNGGTITQENMNYRTAQRIAAVWPSRFSAASAQAYVGNPKKLASKVYNGRMGNRSGTEDGYTYRGQGLLQLTGRSSYVELSALVGVDLVTHPEFAFAPQYALEIAAAEFKKLGCLPACDADNLSAVTKRVNGGLIGLDSRRAWLSRWKQALPELPGDPAASEDTDTVPRGAEAPKAVPMPPVSPETGTGSTVGVGAAYEATDQLAQVTTALTPLQDTIHVVQWVLIAVGLITAGLTLYALWHKYRTKGV